MICSKSRKEAKLPERKICETCKFADGIGETYGPSPSGKEDGVLCKNIKMAEDMDANSDGKYAQEEFAAYGGLNLFRIEVIDDEAECPHWGDKSETPH